MSTSRRPESGPPHDWWEAVHQWSESWWAMWRATLPQMPWPPAGTVVPPPVESREAPTQDAAAAPAAEIAPPRGRARRASAAAPRKARTAPRSGKRGG
ncbi:hypothetical protein [Rivibacter subsaxonicus]|uniref:Uncharacterized protein n=1 Tax=Rivibacter subsaxonicus TaxID=457575 RepID=A0A4Q7VNM2_9BURK|nr:hypothetical protein [Rivibacter subsaxonicus]RZT97919.1 hypothetical protein EV670_2319 [Rivibacter subsaxonicus]